MALGSGNGLKIRKNFALGTGTQCAVLVLICYPLGEKTPKSQDHAWKYTIQENPRRNLIIGSNFFVVSHAVCTVPSFTD